MRSRLLATLLGTGFLLGCQESGPVGPDTESVETSSLLQATTFTLSRILPVSSNIDPPCVSERIFFSGDAHVVNHLTFTGPHFVSVLHAPSGNPATETTIGPLRPAAPWRARAKRSMARRT